jgi:glycosyltransferase involved in cell wall biosynthesis
MRDKPRVDQLVGGYAAGDAISQEARLLRDMLRAGGFDSDIYASGEHIAPESRGDALAYEQFDPARPRAVIFHFSTATKASQLFAAVEGKRIVRYHNITPATYFDGFDDAVALQLRLAREELASVVRLADVCWSDSAYNASEIETVAGARSVVLPLFFSEDEFASGDESRILSAFDDSLSNWLFVGRIAPNKCVEELILAFAWYYRCINPASRLLIAGSESSCPRYYAMLRLLAARLGLMNVCFTGFVSTAGRHSLYRCADVFVSASRHEGFCLPLVEAMASGVPVVARDIGGMPETLGDAGIRFDGLDACALAVLISRVTAPDGDWRAQVLNTQARRMETLRQRDAQAEFMIQLNQVLGSEAQGQGVSEEGR